MELDTDQVEEYLYYLIQKDTDAKSSFKHLVHGLRKLYLLMDREGLHLALTYIGRPEKLLVVLSTQEVASLLKAPKHFSKKVLFDLIYDTGFRIEVVNYNEDKGKAGAKSGFADMLRTVVYAHEMKCPPDISLKGKHEVPEHNCDVRGSPRQSLLAERSTRLCILIFMPVLSHNITSVFNHCCLNSLLKLKNTA